jgi:Ca2+-dependent lipid-binding protein
MIEHRMQKFKSKVSKDGGKEPKFNETFLFEVKYIGDDFTMKIMNKNMIMNDDTLGEATIKISGLCLPGGMDDWWKL